MIVVRPAGGHDLPALAAILAADGEPLDWPGLPGWPYLEHLLERADMPVAELDGDVVGFAGSIQVGDPDIRFLTDLYVDPRRQDLGAGRALLESALGDARERMTFSSADDRALGLYIRAGMRPWWPLLYCSGETASLGTAADGVEWRPATLGETAARSLDWTGVDRSADFAHYASLPDAIGFAVVDSGSVAAVGWARRHRTTPGRWLDHASIAPDADPVRAAIGAWRAAAPDGGRLTGCLPGPHPAVPILLANGVRIAERDQWCASDPDLIDPLRLLPNPGFL